MSTQGQWLHEFHQLPLMPPLVLLFGAGAAPLFDAGFLRRYGPLPIAALVVSLALFIAAVEGFRSSNVTPSLYRNHVLSFHFPMHGNFLQSFMPADELVITVDDDANGANSPMLLYYARRQGWSFDIATISPQVIDHLRSRFSARYFASSIGGRLLAQRPEVKFYLEGFEHIPSPPGMEVCSSWTCRSRFAENKAEGRSLLPCFLEAGADAEAELKSADLGLDVVDEQPELRRWRPCSGGIRRRQAGM